jgi:hypothetical protein
MGLLGTIGGIIGGNKAAKAAGAQAAELRAAGNTAFESSRFRPVGVTTAFGTSNYTVDPTTGALTGAGYNLTPEMQAIQGGLLSQAGGVGMNLTGQGLQGAQSLFNLGQQFLPTSTGYQVDPNATAYADQLRGLSQQVLPQNYDTTAAAQQYMQQQQALLQPSREQAQAGLTQNLFNTGRGGVAVSQGGMLGAANPEQQALLNARSMQDLQLAANAQQQARANLSQDISLGTQLGSSALNTAQNADTLAYQRMLNNIQTGSGLFGAGAQAATAGYSPLQTALTGAASLDKLGQQSLGLGMDLGNTASAANARASQLRLGTAAPAAQAQFASSSWSPWAAALGGLDKAGEQAINALAGNMFGMGGSVSTPMNYGTNFGSQQSRMLAEQDAWFK